MLRSASPAMRNPVTRLCKTSKQREDTAVLREESSDLLHRYIHARSSRLSRILPLRGAKGSMRRLRKYEMDSCWLVSKNSLQSTQGGIDGTRGLSRESRRESTKNFSRSKHSCREFRARKSWQILRVAFYRHPHAPTFLSAPLSSSPCRSLRLFPNVSEVRT